MATQSNDSAPAASVDTIPRERFDTARSTGDLTAFSYTPNSRGFIFLQICSALLFIIAYVVYLATGFTEGYWTLLSGFLTLIGVALLALVVRWSLFARRHALGFDPAYVYVASGGEVTRIPRHALTAQAAGFIDGEQAQKEPGTLHMHVDDKDVTVILFNPFVMIEDFPVFLGELLIQIRDNSPRDDDEEAIAVDGDGTSRVPDVPDENDETDERGENGESDESGESDDPDERNA